MKGVRDWVFTQLLSKSWASSRSLSGGGSFFLNETVEEEPANDRARLSCSEAPPSSPPETSYSLNGNQDLGSRSSLQQVVEDSHHSDQRTHSEKKDATAKVEDLQVTFFRLLQRFGYSPDNPLVPKVLYRLHLAASIRAEGSDLKRLRKNRSRAIATEQEAAGVTELRFSIRILVLGKTGVGKSATINSIFDNIKTDTDAFQPATKEILEVVGTINGVKVTFIDTPGFLPSSTSNVRRNRKIMMSIRRYIRKSPPDIVLFFERLDLINMGYYELPLLMLMSEIFGSAIWFNTIIVLTHASPMIPEGPSGYPVNYESYVNQCADLMQFYVHQAVSDSKVEIPVLLVENHSQCRKNFKGESILPNGQAWQSQFFLLCICTKILGDASSLLHFEDSIKLGPLINPRVPSMPHLLSSFLRHQSAPKSNDTDPEIDEVLLTDIDEEDEYDQLPPIKMLTKSQFNRLTKSQKKEYLDELDYRETLYMKKHLREEARRRREEKLTDQGNSREDDSSEGQQAAPEAVLLPDMAVPPSFDSDCPQHRYRCLITSDQWLARPVLDPHGWDHDVGFDGINLETTVEISKDVHASISGQMNKDKNNFSIQSEFAAAFVDPKGPTYSVGVDVQSSGKDLICSAHSNAKLRTLKHNFMDCGVSLTSFGNKYYLGAKVEDTILCGKRLKFVVNAGQIRGAGKVAYGGSFATTLRGSDYPVKNDNVTLSMTALSFNKEMVLNGGLQSEFQPTRGMKMAVNVNLNSQKMGQVSIKLNSSEHLEIAVLAVFSIFNALFQRKSIKSKEVLETG